MKQTSLPSTLLASRIGGAGYLFFFISGATALIYEVLWVRELGLVFGNTTYAVATVLAAYMAGLGLGGYFIGCLADRWPKPLLAYGLLEMGIAAYAAFTLSLLWVIQAVYVGAAKDFSPNAVFLTLVRFLLSSFLLFIPTFFMGATLPVLAKFYIRRPEAIGSGTAFLYGLNTAGAVTGTLLAGFFLLPNFGVRVTLTLVVISNLMIGLFASLLSQRLESGPVELPAGEEAVQPSLSPSSSSRWLIAGIFVSGATAMIYEVGWTRTLAAVLGSSTYAFTVMLATFLLGLALGSATYKWVLAERGTRLSEWGWLQIGISVSALLTLPLYERVSLWTLRLFALTIDNLALFEFLRFLLSGTLMILPTFCFGALFPVTVALYTKDPKVLGRGVGTLYLSNTYGNILGSLGTGFLLIPILGIYRTLLIAVGLNALVGTLAIFKEKDRLWKRSLSAAILGAVLVGGFWIAGRGWDPRFLTSGLHLRPHNWLPRSTVETLSRLCNVQILFYREGLNSIVSVGQQDDQRYLKVNGKTDASTDIDMATQLLSGHLPHLLHANPERSLVIGFGSGTTLAASLAYPVKQVDVVEIEPAVLEAAPYFDRINRKAYQDPRARLIVNDGRNHLLIEKNAYDVIISEPSNPWMSGTANLFTVEFYQLVAKRLRPNGIFCQWLQAYGIAPEDFRMVLASVHHVFPYVTLWRTLPGDTLIIASREPIRFNLDRIEKLFGESPELRSDMTELEIPGAAALLAFFELGSEDIERYVQGTPLHRDDKLSLEFRAPKSLYQRGTVQLIGKNFGLFRTKPFPPIVTQGPPLKKRPDALREIGEGFFAKATSETAEKARYYFKKGLALDPDDAQALVGLGRTYLIEKKLILAMSYFQKAVRKDPQLAEAHAYLGYGYLKGGFYQKAVEHLTTAIALDSSRWLFFFRKARALEKLGRSQEALEAYRSARELNPGDLNTELAYAESLTAAGRPREAIEVLEALRREFLTYKAIYPKLREAYNALGDLKPAIQAYEELVRINPYFFQYWIDLAHLYEQVGDSGRKAWALRQGKKTHPFFEDLVASQRTLPS